MKKFYEQAVIVVRLLTDNDCITSSVEGIDEKADGFWGDNWE